MIDLSKSSKQHMNILYINCILVVVHGKDCSILNPMFILKTNFDVLTQSKDLKEFIKNIMAYCCEF
jgi:hypothetical protein